jgi:predicted nucleic acid-binding protein
MRLVLDASVAVAAARAGEPAHAAARARLSRILSGADEIVVPTLFAVEVTAALARAGEPAGVVRAWVDAIGSIAVQVVPLGSRFAARARETAMRWKLRAADAVYVALAAREGIALCTIDQEVARRSAGACRIIAP